MKKFTCAVLAVLAIVSVAQADLGFYAITNTLGYQGTIWNETDGTGPWATVSPRAGYLYFMADYPASSHDYNYLMSNWYEHSTTNQNPSFFQMAETDNPSVTSATGGWDATRKVFTTTVTGSNAPYPWSRFWQPDNGVAWGVTILEYSYTFTATFSTAAAIDADGWLSNTVDPDTIVGSFTGRFLVTADVDKSPIIGDTYGFDLTLSKALFPGLDAKNADGGATSTMNYWGAAVPAPGAALLAMFGLGIVGWIKRRVA